MLQVDDCRSQVNSAGSLQTAAASLHASSFSQLSTRVNPDMSSPRQFQLISGDMAALSEKVRNYVLECARICRPDNIFICDGSEEENAILIKKMLANGMTKKLPKYENW